jgi:hypothetical protein
MPTVLFEKDWKHPNGKPRAIPHATTKNTSFLRMCQLLKRMEIKNCYFPLALFDPKLLNVDVYDLEDDTPENEELRIRVQVEARRNVWYYLRECVKIYEQGGSPVPFRLDRGSMAMTWCFSNGLDYCGMQPRQTGKANPLDALVLTTRGWVKMGDIQLDDEIVAPNGGTARVVGIYPQGIKPIYKITLIDGRSAECCEEHLWMVRCDDWEDRWRVMSLKDIKQSNNAIMIPIADPDFPNHQVSQIQSIEYVGDKEAQCIEVDHPDHLYITNDYLVTHNTVCALSLISWVLYIGGEEFTVGGMAKDNALRQENVKRVKAFGENLPKWWLVENREKDKKNAEEILYSALRTHYVTMVAQAEKSQADKQARGASMPMLHYDEFEFTTNIGISYPAMLASTGTARENAKKNGKPHSNIITTTAGDPTKKECKEAIRILEGAMSFNERLYDMENTEQLHEIVEATSPQKMIIGVFSHQQLGYDNKWLSDKITRNRMTRDQVLRDYLNRRVSIQDDPVISKDILNLITSSQEEPVHTEIISGKFLVYWYISKEVRESQEFRNRPIVLGCDSSEMIGRDATTLVGIDPRSLETVCTFRTAVGNINVVGAMIADLLLKYPKMIWVPENKSSGTALIDNVSLVLRRESHNPFLRIYNRVISERHEEEFSRIDYRDTSLLDTNVKRFFGIKTDKGKRDQLYSAVLLEAAERAARVIKDRILIEELSSLTNRNGRVDHAASGHDDTCVAWLMAMWFILHGKHLDLYGIKPGSVLSYINPGQPDKNRLSVERQLTIRNKIEELEKQLKSSHDPILQKLIKADIALFKTLVSDAPVPMPTTADEFNRDPRKFTDPVTAEQSRTPINRDDFERTLRSIMGLNR